MKQTFAVIIFLGLLLVAGIYVLIPGEINVEQQMLATGSQKAAIRVISDPAYWARWWPDIGKRESRNTFTHTGTRFTLQDGQSYSASVLIEKNGYRMPSVLTATVAGRDSLLLNWTAKIDAGGSPWSRFKAWRFSKKMRAELLAILLSAGNMLHPRALYGSTISVTQLTDSTMITLKQETNGYPTVTQIYSSITQLRQYAAANEARPINHPMLNITRVDSGRYAFMVALPINKALRSSGNILPKEMLSGGRFLVTNEIRGGFARIDSLLKGLEYYKDDYDFTSPAIPFQSLITDRSQQPDSNKWITKLYYPVF